ncbi:DNA segregation ATPase FtsK/SpoIIIE, S-DNA-T family [Alteribacillus persepolensis]|uniref:DNA segregation ATPase FtsK/SpoIIIE, S-DNA-T family n=1 Tax=Alteribacillus persepolensis TaxID=568899 RepID=A0A1G8IC27_9BACI|nr:FtsK/SpoIIIE domain-containing protein [Alteribacillus persepolensis]SDI16558.1 DNA segregation ATPase FtsK/SpoIIIE, S-DNA-T family [Alteribacillus persepolensis]
MIVEITSSLVACGVLAFAHTNKHLSWNDAQKIQRIFNNANLYVKENGKQRNIRLYTKRKIKGGTEYIFQLPYGLSVKDIEARKHVIENGLNTKTFSLDDLKDINWKKDIIPQLRALFHPSKAQKEVEFSFDGMLKIKVYDKPLPSSIEYNDAMRAIDWRVPVGLNREKVIRHDFEKRPHIVVAGATGFGKSQYLKLLITSLIQSKAKHVTFSLVDLKGGTAFQRFKDLDQTKYFARDPSEARDTLELVQQEMDAKLREVVNGGFEDVAEAGEKNRHFVMIDEAADLDKESLAIVTDIARRGRAAGYRLVYATQYPTNETLPSQVRQNIGGRVSFILETAAASLATLDEKGAEELPEIPGRAIYKRVKKETVQCPYISNEQIKERITPHVNMRGRGKDEQVSRTEKGEHSFVIEETGLSD